MKRKATQKKYTLKKRTSQRCKQFFKESIFSGTQKEIQIIFFTTLMQMGRILFASQKQYAKYLKIETALQFYKK